MRCFSDADSLFLQQKQIPTFKTVSIRFGFHLILTYKTISYGNIKYYRKNGIVT